MAIEANSMYSREVVDEALRLLASSPVLLKVFARRFARAAAHVDEDEPLVQPDDFDAALLEGEAVLDALSEISRLDWILRLHRQPN